MRSVFQRFFATPKRVLVVDPDQASAQALMDAIASTFHVKLVATADEALSQLDSFQPDLVVTELELPDRSGLDLLRASMVNGHVTSPAWIIATSRRTVSDKVAAFQAGAADYLVKPLQLDALSVHLVNLYRHRQVVSRWHLS